MSKYKEIAEKVLGNVGGASNVDQAWHCITRLRFNLHDKGKVDMESIKRIDGVLGAQFSGDQFQVIVGNKVSDVFAELEPMVEGGGSGSGGEKKGEKQGIVSATMDFISGVFTPILPALAGAGLLKGFLALFVTLGWMNNAGDTYAILNAIGDSVFYFLPFFLAVSAARKVKTNEYLALIIAGTLMYPTFIDAANGITDVTSFSIFGLSFISIPVLNYSSSVVPIILAVLLLKYVYNAVKKVIPSVVSLMFSPMITFLIVLPITLWLIGPLGTNLGEGLSTIFVYLFDVAGPVAGLLLGGFMPLIIMTGMHYAFVPIAIQNINNNGTDTFLQPMMFISNLAQAGASFGVAVRSKNKAMKQLAVSSGISAMIGITEPAMYGVNMKLKKPFIYAMISSGILGAFAGWYGFKAFALGGLVGVFSIPVFADPSGATAPLVIALILFVLSLVIPFILTMVFGFKDIPEEGQKEEAPAATDEKKESAGVTGTQTQTVVQSPLKGELVPLKDLSDPTFAQEIMGKGIAIEPSENHIVAPVSGTVMVLPDSQHAIGIKGDNGEEILIHIGIDTVSLKGQHFNALVKAEDRIEVGQKLIEFDREAIKAANIQTVTMIIVTNTPDYLDVLSINDSGPVFEGEQLLTLVR
ncbi:beta-glucoside-specific PTS transporter subunit IIABC [Alkalicoccobacillus murimartini]|uniref:PTS system beta-glucosides-specific IIC component n=1 Tax=Alkalicoccobacillus murimartini TaxID=171685 RepID=A0ABT9YHH1_9BACI|nr:beta-glucoside-specific PTS transporter subunit IIABC [Alkalicoccobacillus murimartini]MDQ0207305.1 PTS system beta-glucosides-specific IIC component [Alkalicoccobacillus murimartini]